jgi:acyl-CoA reductase-like NAD-dependent aldehyde dehydrogenase
VPESLQSAVVEALVEQARAARVGEGTEEGVQLGPINNAPQYARVKELVSEAIAKGASAPAGGHAMERPGYFFEPTILTNLAAGSRIVDEEQFGPALPVITYRELDDAIEQANSTHFGLSGSVWGTDHHRANAVAQRLECGTAWVNTHLALAPHQPFGGFKWSGIGIENGPWGLAEFTEVQTVFTKMEPGAERPTGTFVA